MPKRQPYNEHNDNEEERLPSRSEIKREAMSFQKLGEKVVELSNKDFAKIPLWPALEEAILLARRLPNRDAKRRQIRLIGKLLRTGEHDDVSTALKAIDIESSLQNHRFHAIEKLRDELIEGNDQTIQGAIEKYASADRGILRQLVRNARKESSQNQAPKSARKLFSYLRGLDNNL
jgi:ribosome-associated protein